MSNEEMALDRWDNEGGHTELAQNKKMRSRALIAKHIAAVVPNAAINGDANAATAPKTLHVFTEEEGAEEHCQMGNMTLLHQVVFDWLDKTLKREEKEKDYERRIDHAAEFAHI